MPQFAFLRPLRTAAAGLALIFMFSTTASALCVNVHEANLRSGPGTDNQKTWTVYMYMPFKVLEQKDGWYKVEDVDGDVHWIFGKLVDEKMQCATVKVDKANVRSGPGTDYDKTPLDHYEHYHSFKVVKDKGEWVQIIDENGNEGWVFKNLIWIQ